MSVPISYPKGLPELGWKCRLCGICSRLSEIEEDECRLGTWITEVHKRMVTGGGVDDLSSKSFT